LGVSTFGYDVDQRNRIANLKTNQTSVTPVKYDAAGNLQFDGTYFYQYDAWNRLIQVNQAAQDTGGQVVIGVLVKNWSFDGLGRLARTVSSYPNPNASTTPVIRSVLFLIAQSSSVPLTERRSHTSARS